MATGPIQTAALNLTREQIGEALALAAATNYNNKVDPAFVGAVLMALAINTGTINDAMAAGKKLVNG